MVFPTVLILVTLLNVKAISNIRIATPSFFSYISLTQYGYVYQPVPDCLAHFTFQVKACRDVHVGLFNTAGEPYTYGLVLGGWGNAKSRLRAWSSSYVDNFERNIVDCNVYKSFWVSWRNNVISVGRGNSFNVGTLLSFTDQHPNQIRYVGITTGFGASGEWEIPIKRPPLHCYQHVQWSVKPGLQNTNMTANITWSVTADNLGQCAVACKRSNSCVSFVYNNEKETCQGHGLKFHNIAEGQGHIHKGSHYFTKH
ncbi:C3 and PZP-like alpha-2-macroglobulin domain-containing protein 8 [Pecten maximus]|uniref:C3 and PZP-like alpha-2-macroglobulin domain-containing protein 8 n=1 Tax=Pecten maximus TaxID=6579 RepID=UPI0014581FD6|nr:C3 and PZP-like alpha-2-macroglobulin domain-containing protein 8 [Pecten maximus]